jgi:hypothetical protein
LLKSFCPDEMPDQAAVSMRFPPASAQCAPFLATCESLILLRLLERERCDGQPQLRPSAELDHLVERFPL